MICQDKNMTKIGQKLTFCYSNEKIAFTMEKKEGKAVVSEFLAKRITRAFIRKFQIKEEDWDLYYLGIEVIVTTALTGMMIMMLGIGLRNFFGSIVFLLCFMSIRSYSGGYHAKTRLRCFFVSVLCYLLSFGMMKGLLCLPEAVQNVLIAVGVAMVFVHFAKFAPVENPNKRIREEMKERNKIMSFFMLICWYLICSAFVFAGKYEISTQIWATIEIIALLLCVKRRKKR